MRIAACHPTQPVGCVGDVTAEPFVLPTCPANQGTLQVSENWGQRRPIEPAVVVHPAAYRRIHQTCQVFQGLVVPRGGQPPATNGRPDRLARLVTHPGQEAHERLPPVVLGPPRPKRVAQRVELNVLVLALPVAVLTVHDLGLLRVKFQTAFRQTRPDRRQQLLRLSLALGVDDQSSSPGEFHPQALTEPDGKLALHPALHTRHWRNGPAFRSAGRFLPFRVDLSTQRSGSWLRLGGKFLPLAELTRQRNGVRGPLRSMPITGTSPLLQAHPPLCLASVVSASGVHPLRLFPSHQGHRFPGSLSEPRSESRHLNAGRHAGSKRISPAFIPGQRLDPGFDVVPTLSTLHRWFTCVRLSDPHLTRSRHAFSLTLTTGAFDPSRSRWFAACLRRPAARGLPSSRTDIAWRTSSSPGEFHPQALTEPDGKLALHPALHTRHWRNGPAFRSAGRFLPFRVDLSTQRSGSWLRLGGKFLPLAELTRQRNGVRGPLRSMPITGTSPLLQAHPPLCLASVVSASGVHPLRLFPSHQGPRFPGSLSEPRSESRHLNAGRHAGSKRISPAFIPGQRLDPGFDVVPTLSTLHRWFTCVRLSDPHLTRSRHAFSLTLTTGA